MNVTNFTNQSNSDIIAVTKYYKYYTPPLIIFGFCSVIVNVRVLLSTYWVRRPLSPTLHISLSLAGADALASTLIITGLILNSYLPIVVGIEAPYLITFILELFRINLIIITVFHLLALSLNHYLGIVKPLHYISIMTTKRTVITITILWILPPFLLLSYFLYSDTEVWTKCEPTCFLKRFPFRLVFALLFFIPLVMMAFCYTHILLIVKKQHETWTNRNGSTRNRGLGTNRTIGGNRSLGLSRSMGMNKARGMKKTMGMNKSIGANRLIAVNESSVNNSSVNNTSVNNTSMNNSNVNSSNVNGSNVNDSNVNKLIGITESINTNKSDMTADMLNLGETNVNEHVDMNVNKPESVNLNVGRLENENNSMNENKSFSVNKSISENNSISENKSISDNKSIIEHKSISENKSHKTDSQNKTDSCMVRVKPSVMSRSTRTSRANCSSIQQKRVLEGNVKAMYTTLLILGSCLIGWMPAMTVFLLICTDGCMYKELEFAIEVKFLILWLVNLLIILKTLINPIIYSTRMMEIQVIYHYYYYYYYFILTSLLLLLQLLCIIIIFLSKIFCLTKHFLF